MNRQPIFLLTLRILFSMIICLRQEQLVHPMKFLISLPRKRSKLGLCNKFDTLDVIISLQKSCSQLIEKRSKKGIRWIHQRKPLYNEWKMHQTSLKCKTGLNNADRYHIQNIYVLYTSHIIRNKKTVIYIHST